MTVSQAPEQKKKKRRNRKRRLLSSTEGPESSDLCSDVVKKPRLSSDSAAERTDSSMVCSTRNHNFLSDSAAGTNPKDTPSTVIKHYADTAVARVNSTVNTSGPAEDDEEDERRRIKAHLHKQRKALPIFPVRKELVRVVKQKDCVILIGETACGKTTQLPQYLHATGFTKRGIIGITQPRRVAAVTVADRVAMEMGIELGGLVGYSVRFDDTTSNATRIKYLTDGMLLREALLDPLLQRYAVVVLDEAHERTVNTDILFGVVKTAQKERQRLSMAPLKGWRKVIFSTNIAETSITIPGIKYVVDTGVVKERTYQPGTGLEVLKVRKISKAQAWQRAGRAGRECRLYTKMEYEAMREHSIPEIQRCSLSGVVLQMLALGIEDIFSFDFMDKPSEKLTALGKKMAAFPLEPRFAKIILCSKELGCTDEILTIISILSGDSVLYFNEKQRERAAEVWRKFQSNEGDHVMLLNVYKAYKSVKGNKAWCKENFVNKKNMLKVIEIRSQLADLKCLASGLFTNVAELQKNGDYLTLDARKKVHIHPSSCLFSSSPACVVFTEMVETTKCYMRNLTVVDPDWLPDVAPQYFKKKRLGAKALS
ncbi:ATP-dependent RNA helicase DHX33-like [Dermacentor variabilis]|uniref:ATP-dependent RNA helicase DHX33-like n=1 Tax=Dermacentor variabilis TaxID=34621 RepID=UPI003F5B96BA